VCLLRRRNKEKVCNTLPAADENERETCCVNAARKQTAGNPRRHAAGKIRTEILPANMVSAFNNWHARPTGVSSRPSPNSIRSSLFGVSGYTVASLSGRFNGISADIREQCSYLLDLETA